MSDQSTGRDNVQEWIQSLNQPPNYLPKVDAPASAMDDFREFFKTTLLPWTAGIALGFAGAIFLIFFFSFGWSLG